MRQGSFSRPLREGLCNKTGMFRRRQKTPAAMGKAMWQEKKSVPKEIWSQAQRLELPWCLPLAS